MPMRVSFTIRAASMAVAAAAFINTANAQNQGGRGNGPVANAAPANPQGDLPYAATNKDPVSKWTPAASVGRQLTLNDLLTWKAARSAALSNDGKWFAYSYAPNEGDG